MDYIGRKITGTEYIGYDEPNEVLKPYLFSNTGPGPFGGLPSSTYERSETIPSRSGVGS